MATQVNLRKAKTGLSRLVAQALQGEDVIIMRSGKPAVRLVPIWQERVPGAAHGRVRLGADFEASLPDDVFDCFKRRTPVTDHPHIQLVRRYYDACNRADEADLRTYFTPDAVHYFTFLSPMARYTRR